MGLKPNPAAIPLEAPLAPKDARKRPHALPDSGEGARLESEAQRRNRTATFLVEGRAAPLSQEANGAGLVQRRAGAAGAMQLEQQP
jgi:hypothetical protein